MKSHFVLALLLVPACLRAQITVYNPTFSGDAQSDLPMGSHTLVGGSWNGPSQLAQLDSSGRLPALDGSRLTHLSWGQISGVPATLAGYGIADPVLVSSASYADPAWLASLSATKLLGTLADARLSANIPRLDIANTFQLPQTFLPQTLGTTLPVSGPAWVRVATWSQGNNPVTFWGECNYPNNSAFRTYFQVSVTDPGFFAPTAVIQGGRQGTPAVDQVRVANDGSGHTCLDLHYIVAATNFSVRMIHYGSDGSMAYALSESPDMTGAISTTYAIPSFAGAAFGLMADSVTAVGAVTGAHLAGGGATPAVAAGTGAGTSPSVTLGGTDLSGTVTLTTGASPAASGTVAVITFASAYTAAPHPVFSPGNAAAAALSGNGAVSASATASALTLSTGTTALAASTQYVWHYQLSQ